MNVGSPDSSLCIVLRLRTELLRNRGSIPIRSKRLTLTTASRLVLRPTWPTVQRIPWTLCHREQSDKGVKSNIDVHLAPRLRMCGAVPPLPINIYGAVVI
jgi:hypothetical protein